MIEKTSKKRLLILLTVGLSISLISLSCAPSETEGGPSGGSKRPEEQKPQTKPEKICEPNQELGCVTEFGPTAKRCNEDGTAEITYSCSEGGQTRICVDHACKSVACTPKEGRCKTSTETEVCADDGSGWVAGETCVAPQVCDQGQCLDACGRAKMEGSYIGCDYWATNLDNPYLWYDADSKTERVPKDKRPPFAIVLANMSKKKDSWVTVFKDFNVPAQLIAAREVGKDAGNTSLEPLKTVYSEIQGPTGAVLKRLSGEAKGLVLPRNSTMTLLLETTDGVFNASSIRKSAFHIVTSQPVVAYQFNPFCCNYNFTNDASLLLPTATLTERYMNVGFQTSAGTDLVREQTPSATTLTVVGTAKDTVVKVRIPQTATPETVIRGLNANSGGAAPSWDAATRVLSTTLNAYDVLNLSAVGTNPIDDLTGAEVQSTKPVAVFAGHVCTYVPFDVHACDHLESQLLPRETWASNYVATPLKLRGDQNVSSNEGTYFKFVAEQDGTEINVGIPIDVPNVMGSAGEGEPRCAAFATDVDAGTFRLNARQSCVFGTKTPFAIQSSLPIQVGAFLSGQNSVRDASNNIPNYAGDPAFFILAPQDQYRTDYSFFAPPTYHSNYATVIAPKNIEFSLDQTTVNINSSTLDKTATPDGEWVQYNLPISAGPHTVTANSPIGLIVYGYHNYVSYAYVGGLDLTKLRLLTDTF